MPWLYTCVQDDKKQNIVDAQFYMTKSKKWYFFYLESFNFLCMSHVRSVTLSQYKGLGQFGDKSASTWNSDRVADYKNVFLATAILLKFMLSFITPAVNDISEQRSPSYLLKKQMCGPQWCRSSAGCLLGLWGEPPLSGRAQGGLGAHLLEKKKVKRGHF